MSRGVRCRVWVTEGGRDVLGEDGAELLALVRERRSLSAAAAARGMDVREAQHLLHGAEESIGRKLLSVHGDVAELTSDGVSLLEEFQSKKKRVEEQMQQLFRNPTLTADGIVLVDGKLVLVRRGKDPGQGMYALPGGFVEHGERVEECAVREVLEETGLRTEVLDLVGLYSDPGRDPRGHLVSAAFLLRPVGGELAAGDDAQGVELFQLDALPELAFDHARIIKDFLLSQGRSLR